MDIDHRLTALFKEYDTLREEILLRVRTRFELLGFLAVAAGFLLSDAGGGTRVALAAGAAIVGAAVWLWLRLAIARCAYHLATTERRINEMLGEEVLTWERAQSTRSWWSRKLR